MTFAKSKSSKKETQLDSNDSIISMAQRLNCPMCFIQLIDIKLLKSHYWRVHISQNDIQNAEYHLDKESLTPVHASSYLKNDNEHQKEISPDANDDLDQTSARTITNQDDSDVSMDQDEYENHDEDHDYEQIQSTLEKLNQDEIKYFSLDKDIDEQLVSERMQKLYSNKPVMKQKELKTNSVAWATWRSRGQTIMWPCKIERTIKEKRSMKFVIRYYELSIEKQNKFKMHLNRIEPFYRPINQHFTYKEMGVSNKNLRYEFLKCYTNAMRDFVKQLDEDEEKMKNANNEDENIYQLNETINNSSINSNNTSRSSKKVNQSKFSVCGKVYSFNEVKELAEKPMSQELINENKQRELFSANLLKELLSDDCKDFLIGIMTEKENCARHKTYLQGDISIRRKMKFCSPGPLIQKDQETLVNFIVDLSKTYFFNKPKQLKSYEYDVLYPEAVIWALMKIETINYKRAELKYKKGFVRTNEELVKQRCNEILIKQNEATKDKDEEKENDDDKGADRQESGTINSSEALNEITYDLNNDNQQMEVFPVQIETLLSNEVQTENN